MGVHMKFFNSLTNKKEVFNSIEEGKVSIYVCGPTVYNYVHIGNTRPMIVFDVLKRVFLYKGYEVTFVSNFTDVDDKIIKQAKVEGISERALTDKYIAAYNEVRNRLNLLEPEFTPRVVDTMDDIIKFIEQLIHKGFAYQSHGDVYFRVSKLEAYGQLSGIKLDELVVGASERVDEALEKECPSDFTLWKQTNEGIQFESPWSMGRPGWHSECVVMIQQIFNEGKIDIHCGGMDLKFPHHENEIAQSMALYNHPIATTWLHNQMITINNEKMSKSKGNVLWAKDLIESLGSVTYKWFMLSSHYRNPLLYNDDVIFNMNKEVDKVKNVIKQMTVLLQVEQYRHDAYNVEIVDEVVDCLCDDLNTSLALTKILDQVKVCNQSMRNRPIALDVISEACNTLLKMLDVLGIVIEYPTLDQTDIEYYKAWNEAKLNKDFEVADVKRDYLIGRGIL